MTSSAIKLIHNSAKAAPYGTLDQPVYADSDIGLFNFVDYSAVKSFYLDVPAHRIVALGRQDFWSPGDTWRDITYRLHGNGWSPEVFSYFESPLEDHHFPAPNSRFELRLSSFGGLVQCSNGNHRLVAGRAWMTEKYGSKAVFRKAKVRVHPIHPALVEIVSKAADLGSSIQTATCSSPGFSHAKVDDAPIEILLRITAIPHKVYALAGDQLISFRDTRTFLQRIFPRFFRQTFEQFDWRTTPAPLIKELLDDSWLTPQLASAKAWI